MFQMRANATIVFVIVGRIDKIHFLFIQSWIFKSVHHSCGLCHDTMDDPILVPQCQARIVSKSSCVCVSTAEGGAYVSKRDSDRVRM